MSVPVEWYLYFSVALFALGLAGVMLRRHVLIIFMSVELMLNACNVALVAFGQHLNLLTGQIFAIFVITVAAAEATIGLGIILAMARHKDTVDVADVATLKE